MTSVSKSSKKGVKVVEDKPSPITLYEPGLKLEVSDFKGVWYPVKVLEVDYEEGEVLVHYDKWSSRFDEWIKTDSNRLRPCRDTNPTKIQFKVGEKIDALWNADGHRYPGTIKAIHANDYYEVLFDDGIKCRKKASQIFRQERIPEDIKKSPSKSSKVSQAATENPAVPAFTEESALDPSNSNLNKCPQSIFEPVPTDLGKRKRAHHDYSLFLKIPRSSSKSIVTPEEEKKKRRRVRPLEIEDTSITEEVEVEETPVPEPPAVELPALEIPAKRSRKSSIKAIENIAAAAEDLIPRRKSSRRSFHATVVQPSPLATPNQMVVQETSRSFIDEKGNTVDIKQTSDGGWICPVEKCGKQFRKDSLLQMHLKHYHPASKIQFLGNKMNVFEMAIARTSSSEDITKVGTVPEVVPHIKITRSKSHASSATEIETENGSDVKPEEAVSDEKLQESSESAPAANVTDVEIKTEEVLEKDAIPNELNPSNTNVCVLLEKINLNKYDVKSKPKVSSRGRFLRYSKNYSCAFKAKKLDYICDELVKMGHKKKLLAQPRFEDVPVDVINCECGLEEEFGLMMQCELCQAWQHGNCYEIFEVQQLPQYYVCCFCREPKNLRPSKEHEWYQEVSTTGRLPRFSFGPKKEPDNHMRRTNDLLNTLTNIQMLLRSTQMKISMLNAPVDNPKLVLWSLEQYNPTVDTLKEDYKLNFRTVLRHLLKFNRHDRDFVHKLRQKVEDRLKLDSPERVRMNSMLTERFNRRAQQMILESQDMSQDQQLHAESLNQLHLCKKCKLAIDVPWSRIEFAKSYAICRGCAACERERNIAKQRAEGKSSVKTLRDLCVEMLNKLAEANKDKLQLGTQSTKAKVVEKPKVALERCRVNLHATVVKEQVVLDVHLDSTESKLKELEHSLKSDPESALARLKDLEKLKRKVQAINESIVFMRNMKPEAVQS